MSIQTIKAAIEATGSDLGNPSKMPGYATGTSAKHCKTGSILAKTKGSVCHGCYTYDHESGKGKNNYGYPSVQTSHERRHAAIGGEKWVAGFVLLMEKRIAHLPASEHFFRWHDSGDIQDLSHLHAIVEVCQATPWLSHWLPTHERGIVRDFLAIFGAFPANLKVVMSDAMIDQAAPTAGKGIKALATSGVTTNDDERTCPAPDQDGHCGDCRQCWDHDVRRVVYMQH